MEDTFTIPVSFDEFVTWLDGHARRTLEAWRRADVMTFDGRTAATVIAHGAQYAFTVQDEDADRVTLHAELWSSTEPPAAQQWYADTLQAIRQKWPPATTTRLTGEDLARIEGRIAEFEREQKEMDALFAAIHRGIRTGSTQAPKPAANTAQTPEATVTAAQYLAALIDRTDKGAPQWWADLNSWWTQHCDAYTWVELAEKTGYSQQRLKQELTPKKDAKSSRRQ